jgi:transposase
MQEKMKGDSFSGSVYIFCNRERRVIKAVYWDKTGFWLSQKRLEKEKYPWPGNGSEVTELTWEQLEMLLAGIDFFRAHKEVFYTRVA